MHAYIYIGLSLLMLVSPHHALLAAEQLPLDPVQARVKIEHAAETRDVETLLAAMHHPNSGVRAGCIKAMHRVGMSPTEQIPIWREMLLSEAVWKYPYSWKRSQMAVMDMQAFLEKALESLLGRRVAFDRELTVEDRIALIVVLDSFAQPESELRRPLPERIPGVSALLPTTQKQTVPTTPKPNFPMQTASAVRERGAHVGLWITGMAALIAFYALARKFGSHSGKRKG